MTDTPTDGTEPETVDTTDSTVEPKQDEYPPDHPLVKTLAAQKAQIRELKTKASRLDALEEATKSDAEKAADRISKAEAEAASVPAKVADALKLHLAALHEIDQEDAELFLTATEPDLLLKQVGRLLEQTGKRRKNHVPREGQTPTVAAETSDMREFTRQLFGDQ
jgi:hypothetical protein